MRIKAWSSLIQGDAVRARLAGLMLTGLGTLVLSRPLPAQQRWTPLVPLSSGAKVDIDTASAVRAAATTTVWLRYSLGPREMTYDIRRVQVDCQRRRSRELVRRSAPTEYGRQMLGDVYDKPPAPDSAWQSYSDGSLGAEVITAVCRITGPA